MTSMNGEMMDLKNSLPVLLLKNLLLLPNQEVKLELTNSLSQNVALLANKAYKNELVVLPLKDQLEEKPEISDFPQVAIVAKIKNKIELPNGNLRITLRGLFRAEVKSLQNHKEEKEVLECLYEKMSIPSYDEIESLALLRKLVELIQQYVKSDQVSNSILNTIKDVKDLNKMTDLIAAFLPISFSRKLFYMEQINPVLRGEGLISDLNLELQVMKLDKQMEEKLQIGLEESQKEFILKERLREIQEELGETHSKQEEIEKYRTSLKKLNLHNDKIISKIESEITKLELMSEASPEGASIRTYLDWMLHLPWEYETKDETNLESIKKSLDKTHFGLEKAKNKILEYIAAKERNESVNTPILCLIGPPGVGKTTLAKSIAESLNKSFYKISVGGLNDSSILTGYRRTYLGSSPGKIIEALKRCGSKNPVILIDEVDKMVKDYKGDPSSALLDILDKEQNPYFIDYYIEEEFDLSHVLFILTANDKEDIPYELYDRLEVVELSSYTVNEKMLITKKYLLPLLLEEHKLTSKNIKFLDGTIKEIIENYTNEAGVRDLYRLLTSLVRKLIVQDRLLNIKITHELVLELLGPGKYTQNSLIEKGAIGVVNALAITNLGGKVLPVETCIYPGNERIKITGFVERVMEESISVAISYLLSHQEVFQIHKEDYQNKNIHIHLLEAGMKKDGPSAGVSITTALLSLAKHKKVPDWIAMTGEMTLLGYVKKIGGLKEKLIGAYHDGIKEVFIPKENHYDLEEVPKEVLENLKIIEVEQYEEIYKKIFLEEM